MVAHGLAGISALLLTGVGWIVGGRLLLLASRTRQLPELALGIDFWLIGGIGYPLAIASGPLAASSALFAAVVALVASTTASHVGMLFHGIFTRAVFRPQERWARWAVIAAGVAAVIGFLASLRVGLAWLGGDVPDAADRMAPALFLMGVAFLICLWSAIESFAFHAKARRRLALGMIEPVVVNRSLLFGIHSTMTATGCLVNAWFIVTSPLSVLDPTALTFAGLCGTTGAVAVILGLMPPAGYLRWIDARHAARAPASAERSAPPSERAA